jgi:hypothetical protein
MKLFEAEVESLEGSDSELDEAEEMETDINNTKFSRKIENKAKRTDK